MFTLPMTTTDTMPADLQPGDEIKVEATRNNIVVVKVICRYGRCTHDDRPQSVHVRSHGADWFAALIDRRPVAKLDR